jgi:hypothetical protein
VPLKLFPPFCLALAFRAFSRSLSLWFPRVILTTEVF